MDLASLGQLLALLKSSGVTHYRGADGVELHLGPVASETPATPAANEKEPDGEDVGNGIRIGVRR